MNFQDKRVRYLLIITLAITGIVSWRIFNNLSKEQAKANRTKGQQEVVVNIATPKRTTIVPTVKLTGSLEPHWQADVAAKVPGRIEKINCEVGQYVKQGTLLAALNSDELAAAKNSTQGSLYDARASLASANVKLSRYTELYANGAISKEQYDNAKFARDMAAGKVKMAEGNHQANISRYTGSKVYAPHNGTIVKKFQQEGFYATNNTPLFRMADISRLKVMVSIPEGEIGGIGVNNMVNVMVPSLNNQQLVGRIARVADVADMPSRTYAAEVLVDNNGQLKGGMFADVQIERQPKANVMTVPLNAIIMRQDQRTVYVMNDSNKVVRRVLKTGYIGDGLVEVISGLQPTDKVIVSGLTKIKEGTAVVVENNGDQ